MQQERAAITLRRKQETFSTGLLIDLSLILNYNRLIKLVQKTLQELQQLQQSEGGPNHVLRVVVENMIYTVTLNVLYQIFSKFGPVLKIITFTKNSK